MDLLKINWTERAKNDPVVNALGFAGYLLCTDHSDRPWLDRHGPDGLLKQVISTAEFRGSTDALD